MKARVWSDPVVIRYASQLRSSVSEGTCFFFLLLPTLPPSINAQCCSWNHSATQFFCVCLVVLVNTSFLKSDAVYNKIFNIFCFKCTCTLQMFINTGNLIFFNIHSPQTCQFCRKMPIKYSILYVIMTATILTQKGGKTKALVTDL